MTLILGIDPGSRITGFGLIRVDGARFEYVESGCIRLGDEEMPQRLKHIFECISTIIDTHRPAEMAIEQVFMAKSPGSALKLGQARGVAIVAAVIGGLAVHEYSARRIKQSVVGTGAAAKEQVQHMVRSLLKLRAAPQADAADALAAALCHAQTRRSLLRVPSVQTTRRRRMR